jgi:translation initiation factor IF-3
MLKLTLRRLLVNDQIFISPIRVLNQAGEILGNFQTAEAILLAKNRNTDLVLVGTNPPSAVLANKDSVTGPIQQPLEAFAFDPSARVKKIVFGLNIDTSDFERKIEDMRRFLKLGWRCEVSLTEARAPSEAAQRLVSRISAEIRDVAKPPDGVPDRITHAFRMSIWPCTRDQAANYKPPTSLSGSESADISVDEQKRYREWRRAKDPRYDYKRAKKDVF